MKKILPDQKQDQIQQNLYEVLADRPNDEYLNRSWLDPGNLYKVVDTCYYNNEMKYCPILLEIGQERIKKLYNDSPYLLQVWHTNGTKVYEIPLKQKFKLWTVTYRFLLFTMEGKDDAEGYLQIVDLDQNNKYVKVIKFGLDQEDASNQRVRTYQPKMRILGFVLNIHCVNDKYQLVVLETYDNQLDFNKFFVTNFADDQTQTHKFEQYRHILPRQGWTLEDPIIKNCFIFANGFNYTLSMRKSGAFDIYWNMARKDSVSYKKVSDIEMSMTSLFFKMQDGTYLGFPHKGKSNINFQEAEEIPENEAKFETIHVKRVQNIVKLYTGVQIVKIANDTMVLITHGKFVSIYEITLQKWLNHIEFEDDILTLFRHYKTQQSRFQSILCKNGAVYIGVLDYDSYTTPVPTTKRNCKIEGEILRFNEDIENGQSLYITHKVNGSIKLSCIYRGAIKVIDIISDLKENCSVACLQVRGNESHLIIQNDKKQYLYKQKANLELALVKEFSFTEITGCLHSGCSYDINKTLFTFDSKNLYVFKIEQDQQSKINVYNNVFCIGFQNFTKNFNYAICQENSESLCPGFRLFDMESIYNKNKIDMLLLKKIDIGTLGYFEFGANVVRFCFLSSLNSVVVTPILHRNMNKFIGISALADYICYNVIGEHIIALNKKGELFTWNYLTAKFVKKVQTEGLDLDKYTVFSKYRKGPVLLKSNETVTGYKDEDYFFPWELQTEMENQVAFVKSITFSYRKYRYIEIISPNEVKIHLEYVQPSYEKQWIFINSEFDRMVTILTNYRTYFYKAVKEVTIEPNCDYKIKWQLVRCIHDYPAELENDAQRLEFFSPCLRKYLVLDKKSREFVVRESESGFELGRIPKDILTVEKEDTSPHLVINKIKWLNASKMLVVNDEGYEKIIDLDNNFKDLAENYRPLFNNIDGIEWKKYYYYTQRGDLTTNDVLQRLKRIYQDYKSNYFLFGKRTPKECHDVMFKVDPVKWDFNEQSFSFSHWSLIEQLEKGKLNIEDMENMVVQYLVYDILPGGNTIFHQIYKRKDQIQKLFEICHAEGEISIHVPVLPNFNHQTFFSLCLDQQDYKSANLILKYLALYPIGHHSQAIKSLIPIFIEHQLPSFLGIYLDSRFQQTEQLKKINKGTIKKNPEEIFVSEQWFRKNEIKEKILSPIQGVESAFKMEFLDLPGIYHYLDPAFEELFLQLAETDKYEYFDNRAIQKLIEFNYQLIQDWVSYAIVLPFVAFHILFVIYMNVIYELRKEDDNYFYANWVFAILLLTLSTYFLILESIQFGKQGFKYLSYVWNYTDILAPVGVIILQIVQFLDLYGDNVDETFNRCVMALSTFFMWNKLLYILRIFKKTGYLIRMIVEVVKDMGIFLFILLLTVLAFGDAFLRISLANEEEQQYTTQFLLAGLYAYRMILGDFDTSAFGEVAVPLVWIFFVLCTILDMIVMLNLLIAIISDTYARMTENADQAAYQEMASLICENAYIIPLTIKNSYAKKDKFLICFTDLEKVEKEFNDPVQEKLKHMQKHMIELKKTVETTTNKLSEEQTKMKKDITEKLEQLIELSKSKQNQEVVKQIVYEKFWSRIHQHTLDKMTLQQIRKATGSYTSGFGCDARHLNGCKSGMTDKTEPSKNPADVIYHCKEPGCNFDFCEKCFETYKNAHNHTLEKVTYDKLGPNYSSGWLCDSAVYFKGCGSQGNNDLFRNDNTVVYHDPQCNFDLCDLCMKTYKAK